jgi:hypothetical protein
MGAPNRTPPEFLTAGLRLILSYAPSFKLSIPNSSDYELPLLYTNCPIMVLIIVPEKAVSKKFPWLLISATRGKPT